MPKHIAMSNLAVFGILIIASSYHLHCSHTSRQVQLTFTCLKSTTETLEKGV